MKKVVRFIKWLVIALILVSLGLWVTGHGYVLRAVTMTYLVGQSGPGIDEKDSFFNDTIRSVEDKIAWGEHPQLGQVTITDALKEKIESIRTVGFLVIKNNKLLYENYWGDFDERHSTNSFSAVKSLVSLLIGIAVEEGHIGSIDDKVGDYLHGFNQNGKEAITIRHLLTMSSGLNWSESGANPFSNNAEAYYGKDLDGLINGLKAISPPGVEFKYQSGNTQILGFILEAATGQPIAEYTERAVWGKIGAEHDAYWNLDDENGKAKAFCCFYATPRDYAKLGQLVVDRGSWGGQQVVPADYIDACFVPADIDDNGKPLARYGLHWWVLNYNGLDVFYARGISGQYVIAIPSEEIVIVRTGWKREKVDDTGHPADIYYYLDAAIELTNNPDA